MLWDQEVVQTSEVEEQNGGHRHPVSYFSFNSDN
jgi:hypothetical protein